MTADPFPEPDASSRVLSEALVQRIRAEIEAGGGWLSFERFMQLALYTPGMGYYSAGSTKLGWAGDFATAPELGDSFGAALAAFLAPVLSALGSAKLLEVGAGSGRLAAVMSRALRERGHSRVDYAVLEPSADLRDRQQGHLDEQAEAARWLERLPDPFRGVVVANEVADALPVARFLKSGGTVAPLGVCWESGALAPAPGPFDSSLASAVEAIEAALGQPLPEGYQSEICLGLAPWLVSLLDTIDAGGLLLIDYGMSRRDYYRPDRSDGTLICHYRQRAHSNPLLWPGLQDISAWVDFSSVAEVAQQSGFEVSGYTTQAQFLIESIAADDLLRNRELSPEEASSLKTLILPGEMGESFKLIWLTTSFESPVLPGRDFRRWL